MAMYESRGYCPSNEFLHYGSHNPDKVSTRWEVTRSMLGDRIGYMVYAPNASCYQGCYIVDALKGNDEESFLGIEVAAVLKTRIPVCIYAESGRPIVCTDVINPHQIPAAIIDNSGKWCLCASEDACQTLLLEDNRYLIAVQDDEKEVHLYLFKK